MERRVNINGSTVVGIFAASTDELVLVPHDIEDAVCSVLSESLGATVTKTLINGSSVLGALVRGNSHGFIVTRHALDEELEEMRNYTRVERLPSSMTAVGNIVLANDSAALVNPELSEKAVEVIGNTLGVDVYRGTIGGLKTVGMAGVATNKGLLVHPKVTATELARLEEIFNLPVDIGTVNFGSPLVGSGILANSRGYVAGSDTTGPELGRIEDALGYS